jgi:hypothetical protein
MIGTAMSDFDDVVADFTRSAVGQGYPSTLIWSSPEFLMFWRRRFFVFKRDPEESRLRAKTIYDTAVARRVGVEIEGKCKTPTASICRVYMATDDLDAQYRMIPETGVKMTVAVDPLPVVLVRSRILWWILKRFCMLSATEWE